MKKNMLILIFFIFFLQNDLPSEENNTKPLFRVRTITAGINLTSASDLETVESAITFLKRAKVGFEAEGYEVQTLRIATQPVRQYLSGLSLKEVVPALKKIDSLIIVNNVVLSIGPVITENEYDPKFSTWAVDLIQETSNISFSVLVASEHHGIHSQTVITAAEAMVAISKATKGGEGNFRFTASANCLPGIPFFPAAYHKGKENFAIGLESPGILKEAFQNFEGVWRGPAQPRKIPA